MPSSRTPKVPQPTAPSNDDIPQYHAQVAILKLINSASYKRKAWNLSTVSSNYSPPTTPAEEDELAAAGARGFGTYIFNTLRMEPEVAATDAEWDAITFGLTSRTTFMALSGALGHSQACSGCPLHLTPLPVIDAKRCWLIYFGTHLACRENAFLHLKPWLDRHFLPLAKVGLKRMRIALESSPRGTTAKKRPPPRHDEGQNKNKRRALADVSNVSQTSMTQPPSASSAEVPGLGSEDTRSRSLKKVHKANSPKGLKSHCRTNASSSSACHTATTPGVPWPVFALKSTFPPVRLVSFRWRSSTLSGRFT
ncbi:hypothetical protein C8R45DRAFT_152612 [Mycena sanguinolenta]|nr:hypothetical protein C8R45DRAFT_152612 [Mycena sanguinolenta]